MKLAFRIVIFFTLLYNNSYSCSLNPSYEYTVLSAPVSVVFKELGLIAQVKMLGSFHPFDEKIKKIDGGIFLRVKNLNLNNKSLVFYDESESLTKEFQKVDFKLERIKTRRLSAISATKYIIKKIEPYLVNCKEKVSKLKVSLSELETRIKNYKFRKSILFYLGAISKGGRNNLVIANDGFVLDLKKNTNFRTYPSSLAYVNWSSKILKGLKNYVSIGISSSREIQRKEIDKSNINIYYPGVLIPGLQQVKFLKFLLIKTKVLDQ